MKCKSTVTNLKCTVLMWGYSPTHTHTPNSTRTNWSIIWSVTFRIRECICCPSGSYREESAASGSLWLVYNRISIVVANVTKAHGWCSGSERGQPATGTSSQKHSQTCATASPGVSLVTKKADRGLLVQGADLVLNPVPAVVSRLAAESNVNTPAIFK